MNPRCFRAGQIAQGWEQKASNQAAAPAASDETFTRQMGEIDGGSAN